MGPYLQPPPSSPSQEILSVTSSLDFGRKWLVNEDDFGKKELMIYAEFSMHNKVGG